MIARIFPRLLFAFLGLGLAVIAGCSDDDSEPNDPGPVPTDAEAYGALEDAVYDLMNVADPDEPADIDFTEAYDLYSRIVADDPGNLDAHLGAAVAGIMSVLANAQVNETFHAWEDYLAEFTPFEAEPGFMKPLGIAVAPVPGTGSLDLPFRLMGTTLLAGMQPELKAVDPTIGAVQDVLRDVVIPSLVAATGHLAVVGGDPDFEFTISPRLQGDLEAEPLEFDRTDALALRAGVLLLTAVCRAAVTYDLSFATHDIDGMMDALDRETGNFLRLHSTGAAHLAQAETDFLDAVDDVDDAIDALLDETDSQDDDVIVTGPDSFSEQELRDLQTSELVEAREFFTEGLEVIGDWDGDWETPPVTLTISAHDFFQDPIEDWKQVLPPYTLSTDIGSDYDGYHSFDLVSYTDVVMTSSVYANAGMEIYFIDGDVDFHYTWGHDDLQAVLETELDDIMALINASPEYMGGWGYAYATIEGDFVAGPNVDIPIEIQVNSEHYDYWIVPVFTWEADDFGQWQDGWTNYTLNGLLPDMSSSAELLSTFGFTADRWQPVWTIEWYDVELDGDFD